VNGRVLMYADKLTGSMTRAINEMNRRRKKQAAYNKKHKITPRSIQKAIPNLLASIYERDYVTVAMAAEDHDIYVPTLDLAKTVSKLRKQMKDAANKMDFEKAAEYRDRIRALEKRQIEEMG
jgi:excinuclease ABC subunit B